MIVHDISKVIDGEFVVISDSKGFGVFDSSTDNYTDYREVKDFNILRVVPAIMNGEKYIKVYIE